MCPTVGRRPRSPICLQDRFRSCSTICSRRWSTSKPVSCALGVATTARVQQLPDLPTVADAVPGYEASSVFGVGVPTGTPREITELLNRELDAALADPRIRGRLLELTAIPIPSLAAEFRAEMVATTEKWGRVIRVANIKAE